MPSIKIFTEYSYQIVDDNGKILESNSGFDDINKCITECITKGLNILEQCKKEREE